MKRIELPPSWRSRALVIGDVLISTDWFTNTELVTADSFKLQKRRTEWKHGRIAAKQLAMDLGLCPAPRNCVIDRPQLVVLGHDAGVHLSISHTSGFAAAAIDRQPVGIDIERRRDIRDAASHLFLRDEEAAEMRKTSVAFRMLHFWSAKEAVWKMHGGEIETLKKVAIKLEAETATGLRFDSVETFATGEIVVALTRPTS
jgi:phosphopantetheinyl transferase